MEVLCCVCGVNTIKNDKNMCSNCLLNNSSLHKDIRTLTTIESCRGCSRYFTPPKSWRYITLGSEELIIYCLNRNKTVKSLNIIDSHFLYTEEHSKMLIIEIKVLEDNVEYNIHLSYKIRNKQCGECMRKESDQFWNTVVQVRQHPSSHRSFWFLEQLISSHNAHMKCINIKEREVGIDFYFSKKTNAERFTKFLGGFFGIKSKSSNRLISEDRNSNVSNNKSAISVEMLPFCKDDLILVNLPGYVGLYIVTKINNHIYITNVNTEKSHKITAKDYFHNRGLFIILQRSKDLVEFSVAAIKKYATFVEATVLDDKGDDYEIRTNINMCIENTVYGYSLSKTNFTQTVECDKPIVLVKVKREKNYVLKSKETYNSLESETIKRDYLFFLEDIEANVEIFKKLAVPELSDTKKLINLVRDI